jgi:hypothetical protein
MNSEKYIGLDVHQATISVAVLDSTGKLVGFDGQTRGGWYMQTAVCSLPL